MDKKPISPADIDVHPLRKEEAEAVVNCIMSGYGDSYLKKEMYNPDYIRKLVDNKKWAAYTAVVANKKVVGIITAEKITYLPETMEMGTMVVSPDFRGLGIAGRITKEIIQQIMLQQCSIISECVTIHTVSQFMVLKFGLYPCCFLLNYIPNSMVFNRFGKLKTTRQSFIAYYRPQKNEKAFIYIPYQYKDVIRRIYKRIGIQIHTLQKEAVYASSSFLDIYKNDLLGICTIRILRIGIDLGKRLQDVFLLPEYNEIKTWCLYLPMVDASIEYAILTAHSLGYIFTGIIPGTRQSDIFVMQNITNVPFSLEGVQMADMDTDGWMLEMVEQEYNAVKQNIIL